MKVEFEIPVDISIDNAIKIYNLFNQLRLSGILVKVTIDGGASSMASLLENIKK